MLLIRFLIVGYMLSSAVFSADLTIHKFQNRSGNSEHNILCIRITEVFTEHFRLKQVPFSYSSEVPDTTIILGPQQALIFGSMEKQGERTIISVKMLIGRDRHKKNIEYNYIDDVERNVQPLIDAVFYVFEEQFFANVQIFTKPDSASLIINGREVGVSPWESSLLQGRHRLKMVKEKFKILEDELIISNSYNKFNYSLPALKQEQPVTIIRERVKPFTINRWIWLGAAAVSAGLGVYAHLNYQNNSEKYSLPGLQPYKYETYAGDSERYLRFRTGSIVSTILFSSIFGYFSLK